MQGVCVDSPAGPDVFHEHLHVRRVPSTRNGRALKNRELNSTHRLPRSQRDEVRVVGGQTRCGSDDGGIERHRASVRALVVLDKRRHLRDDEHGFASGP